MKFGAILSSALVGLLAMVAMAGDWPQWRGPDRNGIASQGPALQDEITKESANRLWASEPILGGEAGGCGSISVAGGKAYLYVNHTSPANYLLLTKTTLDAQGYVAGMPQELAKAVEDARTSTERKKLKGDKQTTAWIAEWVRVNVPEDRQQFSKGVRARLKAGPFALPMETLAKLDEIVGRKLSRSEADEFFARVGIPKEQHETLLGLMTPEEKVSQDLVYCLDAETGKTLWKTPLESQWFQFPCSSTPLISGGKCYVWNSQARMYCLDAEKGDVLWKSDPIVRQGDDFHHNRSSSPLLVDDRLIVVTNNGLAAVSLDGKTLWVQDKLRDDTPQASATIWKNDGKTWIIACIADKLACCDPANGAIKWTIACAGGESTPAIQGDLAAACKSEKEGVALFRLSGDKAEQLWNVPITETHTSPIIYQEHIYLVGGAYYAANKGRALCIDMNGKTLWEQSLGQAQLSSPILADGKIIAISGADLVIFQATPKQYTRVGRFNIGTDKWTSPTIVDGRLYLRTAKNVLCYDIRK